MRLTEQESQAKSGVVVSEETDSAGAPADRKLRDKSESAALSFGSHQDALDYAARFVEESSRRFAAQSLNAVDCYLKGEVAAYVRIKSSRNGHQSHLMFVSIPASSDPVRANRMADTGTIRDFGHEIGQGIPNPDGDESAVFLGITKLVQGPEGVIRSFVWLETPKNRIDFRWNVLAPANNTIIGIEEDAEKILRRLSNEPDFVNFLSRLRISIDEFGPWVTVDKVTDHGIEITDVMLCAV